MVARGVSCAATTCPQLSVESLWIRPAQQEELQVADYRKSMLCSAFGDHITYLFVYEQWKERSALRLCLPFSASLFFLRSLPFLSFLSACLRC